MSYSRGLQIVPFALLLAACLPPPPATGTTTKKESSSNGSSNPTGSACGTATAAGICALSNGHKVVKRCEKNAVVTEDCTNLNKVCTLDASSKAVCSEVGTSSTSSGSTPTGGTTGSKSGPTTGPKAGGTSTTACTGNVPATGVCQAGNKMQWCENGKVQTRNCTTTQTCTYSEEGATVCVDNSTTTAPKTCTGVPATGICSSNQVKWCEAGVVKTRDCGSNQCLYSDDGTPYCPLAGCGSVPDTGLCEGTTMRWCEGGAVKTQVCSSGNTCTYGYEGGVYCDTISSGGCDSIPSTGICDGNIAKWCDNGTMHTEVCDPYTAYCDYTEYSAPFCNYASSP